jgi:hypothetical protein
MEAIHFEFTMCVAQWRGAQFIAETHHDKTGVTHA